MRHHHLFILICSLLLSLWIPPLNSEFSNAANFINDLNHYSIAYHFQLERDQEKFDKIFQETPERLVSMKTADQQDYTCVLPKAETKNQRKIEEYTGPTPFELLKPLVDEREISIYGGSGYWFYEVAHGRFIRQYHDDKDTKQTIDFILGTYRHDHAIEDIKNFDQLNPLKTKINNVEYPYFPVHYRNGGTPCDLTGKPRTTTLLYICYEHSRHLVHSITEVSTCNYEIAILTSILCSHPVFDTPTTPEHEIQCYAPIAATKSSANPKPSNLQAIEQRASSEHYVKYSMASDSSIAPHQTSIFSKLINPELDLEVQGYDKPLKMKAGGNQQTTGDDVEEKSVTEQLKELMEIYKMLQASGMDQSHPSQMTSKFQKDFTKEDYKLIKDFWSGKSCFIQSGQGYWTYEFCYNNKVSQFHLEGGKRTKENILGEYDPEIHQKWLLKNREKAFVHDDDHHLKQVTNFYGNGFVCEETGERRSVEVQLSCRIPSAKESPSIVFLSLDEFETCKYTLILESALLCDGLQMLDNDGLMDPNAVFNEVSSDEETVKKVVENIKTTKKYLESFQTEFIIKDITEEEFEEILNSGESKKKEETDEDEKKKPLNANYN